MPTIIPMKNGRAVEQSVLPPIGQGLVDLFLISLPIGLKIGDLWGKGTKSVAYSVCASSSGVKLRVVMLP